MVRLALSTDRRTSNVRWLVRRRFHEEEPAGREGQHDRAPAFFAASMIGTERMGARLNDETNLEEILVRRSYETQQRPGLGERRIYLERSEADRPVAKRIRRGQFEKKKFAAAVRDVDAQFLHQPRRQKPGEPAKKDPSASQSGTESALQWRLTWGTCVPDSERRDEKSPTK